MKNSTLRSILVLIAVARAETESTSEDGVTFSAYNSYTCFTDNTSLEIEQDFALNDFKYTISLWFRPGVLPWDVDKDMTLFSFISGSQDELHCDLNERGELKCEAGSNEIEVRSLDNHKSMIGGTWHLLTLRSSRADRESKLNLSTHQNFFFRSDREGRSLPNEDNLNFDSIRIGTEQRKRNGFEGCLSRFQMYGAYLSDDEAKIMGYSTLRPTSIMIFQMLLKPYYEDFPFENTVGFAEVLGDEEEITQTLDYDPNFDCSRPQTTYKMIEFNGETEYDNNLDNVSIFSTFSLWFWRYNEPSDQTLISRGGSTNNKLEATFDKDTFNQLDLVINNAQIQLDLSNKFNMWLNLVVIFNGRWRYDYGIYDSEGNEIHKGGANGSEIRVTLDNPLVIGDGFKGFIRGLLVTESISTNEVQFTTEAQYQSAAKFGVSFTEDNWQGNKKIRTYGEDGGNDSIDQRKRDLNFTEVVFKEDANDITGTIQDTQVVFDGIACQEENQSLYFQRSTYKAQFDLETFKESKSLTFEMWVRGKNPFRSSGFIFSMTAINDRERFFDTYMAIESEGNQIVCQPFLSQLPQEKLVFQDTSDTYDFWQHVSCTYSLELETVAGHYFYNNIYHSYYQELKSTESRKYLYPAGVYRFCINCLEGGQRRGQAGMYYKDMRLWYSYRTQEQINKNRFQQVGINKDLSSMAAYYKLMSTGNVNYANVTSPELNIDSDVSFVSESLLTVCPFHTFHNQFNQNEEEDYYTCYADPISDPIVVIQHDEEKKEWTVSAEYTFFLSDYASENYEEFISWEWSIAQKYADNTRGREVEAIVAALQNDFKFTIPESSLSSEDRYVFDLYLFSNHGLFTTKEYKFDGIFDEDCDVYDRTTGNSFQQVEITDQRGEKDQYLYVNITESDEYYVRDKNDIIFRYSLENIKALSSDLNEEDQSLRIRKVDQDEFPINQFVSLVITIKFTSRTNRFISFNKVMIYEVAFVYKVVPVLKAYSVQEQGAFQPDILTETQTILKNQLIRFDARQSYVTNWDEPDTEPTLKFQWICPQQIQKYCNKDTSSLDLQASMIREAGFANGDELEFRVNITSGVVQGQADRSESQEVKLNYFNIGLNVGFSTSPTPYNVKKFIAVTAFIEGYTEEIQDEQVFYEWSVSPEVPLEAIPSGLNSKQLTFAPNTLEEGQQYRCTISVTLRDSGVKIVQGRTRSFTTAVEVISRPLRSDFKSGLPFIKIFDILAQQPLNTVGTQFFFESEITGTLVPLSGFQGASLITFLPITKKLYARYYNKNGITNLSEEMKVGIDFQPSDSQELYQEFYRKLDSIIVTTSWEDCMANVLKLAGSLDLSDSIIGSQRDGDVLIMEYREDLFDNIDIILDSYPQSRLALQDSLDSTERANIIYMTISAFRQMTSPNIEFSMNFYKRALDKTFWLWENREYEMRTILTSSWFPMAVEDYLGFLSNLLDFVQIQSEEQGDSLDVSAFNQQYSNATEQVRELIDRVEVLQAQYIPEGIDFKLKVQSINMMIKTYSSVLDHQREDGSFLDELSGSTVTFPIHRARKSTDRVTVSVTAFGMNPFFGSRYEGEDKLFAVITPVAFSVNYRDDQMNLLGTPALQNLEPDASLDTVAFIDFEFMNTDFNKRFFNKDVSFCAPFDEEKETFLIKECEYSFRLSRDQATCSCAHLSYFTLVEDYDDRKPPIAPTFKDIPFVIASIYLIIFVLIGGLVFTINKDRSQKKEIEEANKASFRNERAVYTLNAIAFYRNDIALSLISEENQTEVKPLKLFQLYYQMLHPLSSLYFSFDPSLPKIFYFLVLYLRIMLIYSLSFAMFKDHTSIFYIDEANQNVMAIVMIIFFSLILVPLPFWALSPCRNKHFLSRSENDNDESSEEEESSDEDEEQEDEMSEGQNSAKKAKNAERKARLNRLEEKNQNEGDYLDQEKVFVSLNLPLRLMLLINTNKTDDLISHKVKLPYADGDPEKVVDQIFKNNNKKEETRDTEAELKKARERIRRGKKANEVSDEEEDDDEVGPTDVKIELEGGTAEEEEKKEEEEGKKEDAESDDEPIKNKEVLQEAEVKKLIFRLMLFGIVFLFLLVVIAQAVSSEIGQELYMESEWMFFYVFFGSQLLGFIVVDSIAILLITMFMLKSKNEDRERQVCIAKCCWQAFVWKSDYKFVLDLVKAKR